MSQIKKLTVILNPTAGQARGRRFEDVMQYLAAGNTEIEILETMQIGDATRFAKGLARKKCDVVIAAGGDGTVNEVINGLGSESPPLGILPIGTANVLALEIGLPQEATKLGKVLLQSNTIDCVLGSIAGEIFVQMASVGFDAEVVANINLTLKRYIGKGAYFLAAAGLLAARENDQFLINIDGRDYQVGGAIIANGRSYAGRYVCAPKADLTVQSFEICLLSGCNRRDLLRYAIALFRNKLPNTAGVNLVSGTKIEIQSPAGRPIQADGDAIARTPATIEIASKHIELIVP